MKTADDAFRIAMLAATIAGPGGDPVALLDEASRLLAAAEAKLAAKSPPILPPIPATPAELTGLLLEMATDARINGARWLTPYAFAEWVAELPQNEAGRGHAKRIQTACGITTTRGLEKAFQAVIKRLADADCGSRRQEVEAGLATRRATAELLLVVRFWSRHRHP